MPTNPPPFHVNTFYDPMAGLVLFSSHASLCRTQKRINGVNVWQGPALQEWFKIWRSLSNANLPNSIMSAIANTTASTAIDEALRLQDVIITEFRYRHTTRWSSLIKSWWAVSLLPLNVAWQHWPLISLTRKPIPSLRERSRLVSEESVKWHCSRLLSMQPNRRSWSREISMSLACIT
jgi:hypothetical protein